MCRVNRLITLTLAESSANGERAVEGTHGDVLPLGMDHAGHAAVSGYGYPEAHGCLGNGEPGLKYRTQVLFSPCTMRVDVTVE